jgi:hypothetical protein
MLIEPAIYLNAPLRDFLTARGDLVVREFRDTHDLMSLREPLLFNCAGLGSRELFHDHELIPVRGQLSFLLPQPEIDYMTLGPGDIYMFPRRDGVLPAGTHERGVRGAGPGRGLGVLVGVFWNGRGGRQSPVQWGDPLLCGGVGRGGAGLEVACGRQPHCSSLRA